jgi:hypothetical protein
MQIHNERFWAITDKITTTCTVCAFCRGLLLGAALTGLLWLI